MRSQPPGTSATPNEESASTPKAVASTSDRNDVRRHPHWDVRHAFSNYGFLVLGNASAAAFAFLNIWLTTQALGASGYGAVAALIAAAQVVLILAVNWTAAALFRFGSQEFVEHGRIAESFWARGVIAAASLCVVAASYPWWSGFLFSRYHLTASQWLLLVAFVCSTALTVQMQFALQAAKRPRSTALVLVIERALVSAGLALLMGTHRVSLSTVVLAYCGGAFVASSVAAMMLRDLLRPFLTNLMMARKMLSFSLPLVANGVVGYLASNFIDAFFLLKYLSFAALGVYSVGFQYVGVLLQLPTLAGSLLLPFFVTQISHGREDRIRRYLVHALPVVCLAWSLVCVTAGWLGAVVLPRVLGAQFAQVSDVIWPLVLAGALAGPILFGLAALANAQDRTHKAAVASAIAAGTNVGLDIVWIPRFGLAGCAWATAAAYGAALIAWLILSRREFRSVSVVVVLTPILAGAAAVLLQESDWVVVLATAVAALIVVVTGGVQLKDDLEEVRNAWSRADY